MARQFAALRAPTVKKEKRQLPTGETETRWKVTFYDHAGKRCRRFFHSAAEAEVATKVIQNRQATEGIQAAQITPGLREEAIACQKLLENTGLTLRQAIEIGIQHRPKNTDKPVSGIVEEFLTNRERTRNLRSRTVDDYKYQLSRFCRSFGTQRVDDITPAQIEKWLLQPHVDYKKRTKLWGPKRRNVTRGYLASLFAFGIKNGWCTTNPASAVDDAIVEHSEIEVWTPTEAQSLLEAARTACPEFLPYLAIALFSGIRTCELIQIETGMIKLSQQIIRVPANISKTRKLRLVPITPNLASWLILCDMLQTPGRIFPLAESSLHRRYRILEKKTGLLWKGNALRHSFATYHIAMHDNEHLTSRACGHTPQMLRDHYDAVVSKPDAEAYWDIFPPNSAAAAQLEAAA